MGGSPPVGLRKAVASISVRLYRKSIDRVWGLVFTILRSKGAETVIFIKVKKLLINIQEGDTGIRTY